MELRRYLQQVADNTSFTAWYFGHFHTDENLDDTFYCIYDEIVELLLLPWANCGGLLCMSAVISYSDMYHVNLFDLTFMHAGISIVVIRHEPR